MEGVGLAASVQTLAATALQAASSIDKLVQNCNKCPRELASLAMHESTLDCYLDHICFHAS
jgi:hypothetical protein